MDAFFQHFRLHRDPDIFIEASQHLVASVDHRHIGAEAVHDAGEFEGDIARPVDHQPFGKLGQIEDFVGGDGQLGAVDGREIRFAAGGNQDVLGAHGIGADTDGVGVFQGRVAGKQLRPGVADHLVVDALQAPELPLLGLDQDRPVEMPPLNGPAIGGGILEIVGEVGREDIELLGHAAAMHAGAAHGPFLDQARALALGGGKACRAHPAGTGADGEQIEVKIWHGAFPEA